VEIKDTMFSCEALNLKSLEIENVYKMHNANSNTVKVFSKTN